MEGLLSGNLPGSHLGMRDTGFTELSERQHWKQGVMQHRCTPLLTSPAVTTKCLQDTEALVSQFVSTAVNGARALLEAIGDVQSGLADVELCISGDSPWSKDHAPESIRQVWMLIPQQIYCFPVLQLLERQNSCTHKSALSQEQRLAEPWRTTRKEA